MFQPFLERERDIFQLRMLLGKKYVFIRDENFMKRLTKMKRRR